MSVVTIVDTSILCELLAIPGRSNRTGEVLAELGEREASGERFMIPITAVIETGNFISQAGGDRRRAAERLVNLLKGAIEDPASPFVVISVSWDEGFLVRLCEGNATGQTLVDHLGNATLGAGDMAILVEKERVVANSMFHEARLWTGDRLLAAYDP